MALHCGACMTDFKNTKELKEHLRDCPAAAALLPAILAVYDGADKTGHPTAHFVRLLHNNAHLIKRYARAISGQLDHLTRSGLHSELCANLGLNYNQFRPFESATIKEIPDDYEAEVILWDALKIILESNLKKEAAHEHDPR